MNSKRAHVMVVVLLALLSTPSVYSQLQCGDVNQNGALDVGDVVFLAHYLFDGGPAPESLWVADVDRVEGITISDLQVLTYQSSLILPLLDCSVLGTTFLPVTTETTYVKNTALHPTYGTDIPLYVELWQTSIGPGGAVANGLTGFSFPFSYSCTTSAIELDTIISHVDLAIVRSLVDTVNQKALFTFSGFPQSDTALGGNVLLAELVFRIAEADPFYSTDILIDTTGFDPSHTFVVVEDYVQPYHSVLAIDTGLQLPPTCCEGHTGDVNLDYNVNLTDLSLLVNRLFINFEPLACPAEGNISGDSDCQLGLTDVTLLADYLFVCFGCLPAHCNTFDNLICGQFD